jgi:hypothetical protein
MTVQVQVRPEATVAGLTVVPSSIPGGQPAAATITLDSPAPPGGTKVLLTSSNPAAVWVPASITVGAGQTTTNVTIATQQVATATTATISANYKEATREFQIVVQPQ